RTQRTRKRRKPCLRDELHELSATLLRFHVEACRQRAATERLELAVNVQTPCAGEPFEAGIVAPQKGHGRLVRGIVRGAVERFLQQRVRHPRSPMAVAMKVRRVVDEDADDITRVSQRRAPSPAARTTGMRRASVAKKRSPLRASCSQNAPSSSRMTRWRISLAACVGMGGQLSSIKVFTHPDLPPFRPHGQGRFCRPPPLTRPRPPQHSTTAVPNPSQYPVLNTGNEERGTVNEERVDAPLPHTC